MTKIEQHLTILGKPVRDRVTKMSGIATSVCFDLYGCIQVCVNPFTRSRKGDNSGIALITHLVSVLQKLAALLLVSQDILRLGLIRLFQLPYCCLLHRFSFLHLGLHFRFQVSVFQFWPPGIGGLFKAPAPASMMSFALNYPQAGLLPGTGHHAEANDGIAVPVPTKHDWRGRKAPALPARPSLASIMETMPTNFFFVHNGVECGGLPPLWLFGSF
jgi:hypothetical protein